MSQINVSEKPLRIAFPAGRLLGVLLAATLLAAIACPPLVAQAPPTKPKTAQPPAGKDAAPQADPSAAFFRDGVVPHLSIVISQPEMQKLRDKNREYVRCTIVEDGRAQYERVAIHLKGGAGSFRSIDDKPAMTIKFNKFEKEQLFHGLDKINVNNSVQDPGYLDELICGELFTMAGIPAPRVTHARVKLNGRDLGIFVLKEGFDKKFVKRNGLDPKGNLYEGGFVQDLDGQPRLQSGEGPDDLSDLKAVVAACREPDLSKRWPKMEQVIEIDRFITFMAVELMCCHWDGYCNNHNNYRFYIDKTTHRIQFFPHGMDQMFRDTNFNILNTPGAIVASAVLSNPEWRGRYRDKVSELMKLFVPADRLISRVELLHQRLRPVFEEMGSSQASDFDNKCKDLQNRLKARAQNLTQQNGVVEPRALRFNSSGVAILTHWDPKQETGDARLEAVDTMDGVSKLRLLTITAEQGGRCVASWRTKVLLTAGKYRFEARARGRSIMVAPDPAAQGAGIRVSGTPRTNKLDGTTTWHDLAHEFQVQQPTQEVELVAELRATSGAVHFDRSSLRLVKLGPDTK